MIGIGLPTFDMAEGVLDRAMDAYKQLLPVMGGYVVEGGTINSFKLEQLLHKIARMEADLLSQRVKVSFQCMHVETYSKSCIKSMIIIRKGM